MKRIKIGILSTANIAKKSVIPAILALPDNYELVGIGGRDFQKTKFFADSFNLTPFSDYQSLLDSPHLEAVYIPLPNSLHFEWVEKCLTKGLHVLVEKSMSCSLAEVKALNDLAFQKNLALIENFQFRFHSQLKFIQDVVAEGHIGKVHCIKSSFGFPPFTDVDNIRYIKDLGGGALLDAGAYPLKIVQEFMGRDIKIAASSLSYDKEKGVDISGGAFIKSTDSDLFAEISFGFNHFYQCSIELWGSLGKVSTNRIFTAPFGYKPEISIETKEGKKLVQLDSDNHFVNMLKHFYNTITNTTLCFNEYEQNINQARLIQELKLKADE